MKNVIKVIFILIVFKGVEVITTHSIHNSLHSVGGISMLLPLFAQIDLPHQETNQTDYKIWFNFYFL